MRLRALALTDGSVRSVFEANVVQVAGAEAKAYTSFVDAVSGEVLVRRNQQDHAEVQELFTGSFPPGSTTCGIKHPFELDDDARARSSRSPSDCPPTTSSSSSGAVTSCSRRATWPPTPSC